MLRTLLAAILALAVSTAGAQIVNRPVAAGAISNPGTSLPATCAVGYVYFKSNSTAGQNLHLCTAANTWTQMSGGNLANPVTPGQGGSGVANTKNLTWGASLTLNGTDATTMTFPTTSATIARTDTSQTFTSDQTFTGKIVYSNAGTVLNMAAGGTNAIVIDFSNTSGRMYAGVDSSVGSAFSGSSAYAVFIGNIGNNKLQFGTNNTIRGEFAADGTMLLKQGLQRTYLANSSASYSVAVTDTYITNNVAGTTTLTLPTASTYPGRELVVRTITAQTTISNASNVVPCVGGSAGTAILAATAGKWATLVSDGTNWQIVQCN